MLILSPESTNLGSLEVWLEVWLDDFAFLLYIPCRVFHVRGNILEYLNAI
jgi:hypothetical protein